MANIFTRYNGEEIIRQGIWLYAEEISCNVQIVRHKKCYGSGDYEDPPERQDDREGTFYAVKVEIPKSRGEYGYVATCYTSIDEAIEAAQSATDGNVVWNQ